MKKLVLIAMTLLASPAFADGFVCQSKDNSLAVRVYNNTNASEGTRNAAALVLSNPLAPAGERTVARFTDVTGTLANNSTSYEANVDLRLRDTQNKDALVAGNVALRDLDTIQLVIDFSYANPLPAGAETQGFIYLNTRDRDVIALQLTCARYLKN